MIPELRSIKKSFHEQQSDAIWHSHPTLQIASVLEGKIHITFPHATYEIGADDFLLIADGHLHRIKGEQGTWQYLGFVAVTSKPESFTESAAKMADFNWIRDVSRIVRGSQIIRDWLGEIESYWSTSNPASKLVAQGLLLRLLLSLEEIDAIIVSRESYDRYSYSHHKVFERVIRTIERLYKNKHLKATDIADACSVSQSYLYKLFQKNVGYGPKRFLQQYRVNRAIELMSTTGLSRTDMSISELAELVGFPDVYAFSRLFKRITGSSPSHYRKAAARQVGLRTQG